jgi:hypothetical protein
VVKQIEVENLGSQIGVRLEFLDVDNVRKSSMASSLGQRELLHLSDNNREVKVRVVFRSVGKLGTIVLFKSTSLTRPTRLHTRLTSQVTTSTKLTLAPTQLHVLSIEISDEIWDAQDFGISDFQGRTGFIYGTKRWPISQRSQDLL